MEAQTIIIRVEKEVAIDFRKAVMAKYGTCYGKIKREASKAITRRTKELREEAAQENDDSKREKMTGLAQRQRGRLPDVPTLGKVGHDAVDFSE